MRTQHMRVEFKRRRCTRLLRQNIERRRSHAIRGIFAGFCTQCRAQRAFALVGELVKLLVVKTEQRALQYGRQCKIIVRKQQGVAKHQQVHDGDMFGQHQTVGARDLDLRVFERADHRLEHGTALAYENEHLARPRAVGDPAFHRARNLCGELDRRAGLAGGVERRVPAFLAGIICRSGSTSSQISTSPGSASGKA